MASTQRPRPPSRTLVVERETFSVCRLDPKAMTPAWIDSDHFSAVTRTATELSVVCVEHCVPPGVRSSQGWKALRFTGILDFSLTGILLSVAAPLAEVGVSIFAISTFDTDYVLLSKADLERATAALVESGFEVRRDE